MLKQRPCVTMANPLKDVDSSGRPSAGKRSQTTRMFRTQIAAAALFAATLAGCDKADAAGHGG